MARVDITVPDEVAAKARAAGLNVSRLATAALIEELDRLSTIQALDTYLAELEAEFGPISPGEQADAARWVARVLAPSAAPRVRRRRRSA